MHQIITILNKETLNCLGKQTQQQSTKRTLNSDCRERCKKKLSNNYGFHQHAIFLRPLIGSHSRSGSHYKTLSLHGEEEVTLPPGL